MGPHMSSLLDMPPSISTGILWSQCICGHIYKSPMCLNKKGTTCILNKGQVNLSGLTTPQCACSTRCQAPGFTQNYKEGTLSLSKLQQHTFVLTVWERKKHLSKIYFCFKLKGYSSILPAFHPTSCTDLLHKKNEQVFKSLAIEANATFLHSCTLIIISATY